MNQFIKKYNAERFKGKHPYHALGAAAYAVFYKGSRYDMDKLIQHFEDDLVDYTDRVFYKPSLVNATEYERKMKESGHKNSDFL